MRNIFKEYGLNLPKIIRRKHNNTVRIEFLKGLDDDMAKSVISNIRAKKKTGYYIPNVLPTTERLKLLEFFHTKIKSGGAKKGLLTTYPDSFKSFGFNGQPISEGYFYEPYAVNSEILDRTELDVNQLIQGILMRLNLGKRVVPKPADSSGGIFHSYQFRSLSERQDTIFIHTENMTTRHIARMNAMLGNYKLLLNDFSYFICLQDTSGGEIVLFDYPWREGQYADLSEPLNPKIVDPQEGPVECLKNGVLKKSISVKAGDMILFNGGTTWHMVNKIQGPIERVTLGGFIEPQDNGELRLWA